MTNGSPSGQSVNKSFSRYSLHATNLADLTRISLGLFRSLPGGRISAIQSMISLFRSRGVAIRSLGGRTIWGGLGRMATDDLGDLIWHGRSRAIWAGTGCLGRSGLARADDLCSVTDDLKLSQISISKYPDSSLGGFAIKHDLDLSAEVMGGRSDPSEWTRPKTNRGSSKIFRGPTC